MNQLSESNGEGCLQMDTRRGSVERVIPLRARKALGLLATATCLSLVACVAHAQESEDDEGEPSAGRMFKMQLQAGPRYGTHDLNLGLGGRAGFLLWNDVWLGGSFDYFLGVNQSRGPTFTDKFRMWNAGGEVGYDLRLADGLGLRPYLGFGLARTDETVCGPGVTGEMCVSRAPGSWSRPVCTLGGLLMYTMGIVTVSGDVRLRSVVGSWDLADSAAWSSAWVFGGEVGVAF